MPRKSSPRASATRQSAYAAGYRSGLEVKIADELHEAGVGFRYEQDTIRFVYPAKNARYTPDFVLGNGIIVETKGMFTGADRKKHILIKAQHPDLDIRLVFQNSRARLSKTSNTTYGDWCQKHGFKYANKAIPEDWLKEGGAGSGV